MRFIPYKTVHGMIGLLSALTIPATSMISPAAIAHSNPTDMRSGFETATIWTTATASTVPGGDYFVPMDCDWNPSVFGSSGSVITLQVIDQ